MLVNRRHFENNEFLSWSCFHLELQLHVSAFVQKYANVRKTLRKTQFARKHLRKTWRKALRRKIRRCEWGLRINPLVVFLYWKTVLLNSQKISRKLSFTESDLNKAASETLLKALSVVDIFHRILIEFRNYFLKEYHQNQNTSSAVFQQIKTQSLDFILCYLISVDS